MVTLLYGLRLSDLCHGFNLYWTLIICLLMCHSCNCSVLNSSDNANRRSLLSSSDQQRFACSETTYVYNALSNGKGLPKSDSAKLPQTAITGEHLKICSQGFTCCTEEMEVRLVDESRKEYQKFVQDKIVGLSHTFESRTSKFDRFFRELLANSRRDLHQMFVRTYGMLYEQNADIFTSLFDDLTSYYIGNQKIDLDQSVDKFYQQLYKRMFRILNQPYQFDSSYWDCMTRHMEQLKPFGDVPAKMKQQVTKSFVAARTFVNGLSSGRDVVRQIMELPPSNECNSALMRMMYCPHCRGMVDVKPCNSFCLNVMKGCLAYQTELDHEWNEYLDSLLQLLERLEGPFNIESVIDPIEVKISEAIMIFQDRGKEITDQIFDGCGRPKINKKRSLKKGEINLNELKFGSPAQPAARPTTAAGTSLDRLAKDIREKISLAKGFWKNLPYVLCNDEKVSAPAKPDDADCWNGLSKDKYQMALVGDGIVNQMKNPEVALKSGTSNNGVNEQTLKLKVASSKLRKAFSGQNVEIRVSQSPVSSATADINVQDDNLNEMSGDASGDDDDDSDDERSKPKDKHVKKPSSTITDDEDLVDASGDDSFSGAEPISGGRDRKLNTTTPPPVDTIHSSLPTFSTIVSVATTTTKNDDVEAESAEILPDTNFDVHIFDLPPSPVTVISTSTRSTIVTSTTTTRTVTTPRRSTPLPWTPPTTHGRWVPPAPTTKPSVYVLVDVLPNTPTTKKGAVCQSGPLLPLIILSTILTLLLKHIPFW